MDLAAIFPIESVTLLILCLVFTRLRYYSQMQLRRPPFSPSLKILLIVKETILTHFIGMGHLFEKSAVFNVDESHQPC